jgi:hypothetical protein
MPADIDASFLLVVWRAEDLLECQNGYTVMTLTTPYGQCMQLREKLLHPFHTPAIPHHKLVLAECAQLQRELAGKGPWDMGALKITSCKTFAAQEDSSP